MKLAGGSERPISSAHKNATTQTEKSFFSKLNFWRYDCKQANCWNNKKIQVFYYNYKIGSSVLFNPKGNT